MHLYVEDVVTISIGRSIAAVSQSLTDSDLPDTKIVGFQHTGYLVQVTLDGGKAFHVNKTSPDIQDISTGDEPAVWNWRVTPLQPGAQKLVLTVCFHDKSDDNQPCDKSRKEDITVVVGGVGPWVRYWIAENTWASVLIPSGGILTAIGGWLAKARFRRRRAIDLNPNSGTRNIDLDDRL